MAGLKLFFEGNPNGVKARGDLYELGYSPAARKNITNLNQRSIINEYAREIADTSNARKENFGKIGADSDLNSKDYESLRHNRIDNIDTAGHDGLDGVNRKEGDFYVVEGKYKGPASLNRLRVKPLHNFQD